MNYTQRIIVAFLVSFIFFSCTPENELSDLPTAQPVQPLSLEMAKSLYEKHIGDASHLKSSSSEFNFLPDWQSGQLFSDSNWCVAEFPLENKSENKFILLTESMNQYIQETNNYEIAEQISRLIILQNKLTGDVYSFTMIVMPEPDYLLHNKSRLGENTYLYRDSQLDGTVLFFKEDGTMINGYTYQKGNITTSIFAFEYVESSVKLKSRFNCVPCLEWDFEYGGWISGIFCTNSVDRDGGGGDGAGPDPGIPGGISDKYPPIDSGGGSSPGKTPPSNTNKEKTPEKRTDCTASASQNSEKAIKALKNEKGLKLDSLRYYAANKPIEYGIGITYDPGFDTYSMTFGKMNAGDANSVSIGYGRYTVYTVHTHPKGSNPAPSPQDVISTVSKYKEIKKMGGDFRGVINMAHDGSEYIICVDNPAALDTFSKTVNDDFYKGENSRFKKESVWELEYDDIYRKLKSEKYSNNNAQTYALSYVVDKYNMGLKISYRPNKTDSFKEQKTATEGSGKKMKYKPQICP